MSTEIAEFTGSAVELIGGSRGVFDVAHNGKLLFSKYQTGRFPEPGEIQKLISNPGH